MKNTVIKLNWVLSKANLNEIAEKEADQIITKLLVVLEQNGYLFGGRSSLEEDNNDY
jgi:hypothetical protein